MWEEVLEAPRVAFEPRDFRNALGSFPTGVCLVTALTPAGAPVGLTVNSFASVSLDPPMILWSLARAASCAAVFRDAEFFAVSVLAKEHEPLSGHFARSGVDKFGAYADSFSAGARGIPVVRAAVATFECHTRHRFYGGDHILFVAAVENYAYSEREPLIFHRGRYRK